MRAFQIQCAVERVCWGQNMPVTQGPSQFTDRVLRIYLVICHTGYLQKPTPQYLTCCALLSSICKKTCYICSLFSLCISLLTQCIQNLIPAPKQSWGIVSFLVLNLTWLLDICGVGLILTLQLNSWHFTLLSVLKVGGCVSVSRRPRSSWLPLQNKIEAHCISACGDFMQGLWNQWISLMDNFSPSYH